MVGRDGGMADAAAYRMGPYSIDLRQRIIDAYQNREGSIRELAERFEVAPNTVQNYLTQLRATGDLAPSPHGGGMPRKLDETDERALITLLEEKNDQTLAELIEQMEQRHHVHVSVSTMSRSLHRMGITRKKGRWVPASKTARTFNRPARVFKIGRRPQMRAA
ncbi:helix-turn-helix domain-containing protein [Sorangium sp. So ce1000]|uniref:helix-turn-helix domain-containing protein n=1 Tax=Sorangium sp. So ce1000 TaxID=3133325 RepID=UPI003F5F1CE9